MADELAQEPVVASTPEPAPAPVAETAAPLAQQLDAATATVDPAASTAVAPAAPEWTSIRDYAKSQGVELPYDDDAAAVNALLNAQRQAAQQNYYADVGRRIAPHANEVAEFIRNRQTQQAAPQAPPAWQAPEYKPEWLNIVERDENTGRLRSKAGYDPAIAEKVEVYAQWRDKFLDNPEQIIGPLVDQRAQQLVDAKFAEHAERSAADQIVAKNAGWMFAAGQDGNPVYTPQGQRQLTPEGIMYAQSADQLWRAGLKDVRQIDALARTQVENAVMRQRILQAQPAAASPSAVAAATAGTSVGGQLGLLSAGAAAPSKSMKGLSLREALMVNLRSAPEDMEL